MEWAAVNFWLNLVTLGVIPLGLTVWRNLVRIRENDMHELNSRLIRIEDKLDKHLQYHLTRI